jgi:excisionase family DNA binding protein
MTQPDTGVDSTLLNFDLLPDSAYVTIGTIAALLSVSDATIRRRIAEGSLPAPQDVLGMQRYQVGVVRNTILKAFDLISLDDPNGGFDKEVAHV